MSELWTSYFYKSKGRRNNSTFNMEQATFSRKYAKKTEDILFKKDPTFSKNVEKSRLRKTALVFFYIFGKRV
jgi:hypothetical protein